MSWICFYKISIRLPLKKIDEIPKEKNISRQELLKVALKRREVLREIKDYDKGRKEKS